MVNLVMLRVVRVAKVAEEEVGKGKGKGMVEVRAMGARVVEVRAMGARVVEVRAVRVTRVAAAAGSLEELGARVVEVRAVRVTRVAATVKEEGRGRSQVVGRRFRKRRERRRYSCLAHRQARDSSSR